MNDRRGGRRLPLLLSTCLLLVLAPLGIPGTGAAQGAGAKASAGSPESLLFVQTASKGRLHRNAAGRLILSLKASRWTHKFTDRPQRKAGVERTSGFIGKWARRGFRADPPNAALSIDRPGGEVMSLELKRPRVPRGWLHYSVKRLKGSGKVRLGRFGTASLFIDNAKDGMCFGLGAPCFPGSTPPRMILIFETPSAYSVNFNVTLSGDSASFSPNQLAGGYTGVGYNGPNSVTISVNAPYNDPEYVPVVVQGAGEYEVTTSIPVSVAPDNYSYVPVGPNTVARFLVVADVSSTPGGRAGSRGAVLTVENTAHLAAEARGRLTSHCCAGGPDAAVTINSVQARCRRLVRGGALGFAGSSVRCAARTRSSSTLRGERP